MHITTQCHLLQNQDTEQSLSQRHAQETKSERHPSQDCVVSNFYIRMQRASVRLGLTDAVLPIDTLTSNNGVACSHANETGQKQRAPTKTVHEVDSRESHHDIHSSRLWRNDDEGVSEEKGSAPHYNRSPDRFICHNDAVGRYGVTLESVPSICLSCPVQSVGLKRDMSLVRLWVRLCVLHTSIPPSAFLLPFIRPAPLFLSWARRSIL